MIHGGDLLSYEDRFDGQLIDYSSNINPLGYPQGLEEHLSKSFSSLLAYPDINYRRLKKQIGTYLGCQEDNLVLGNGSVELIDIFISLFDRILVFTPSFYEYEARARVHGKELVFIPYKENFDIDVDKLHILRPGDLLVLGNPNNPTGLRIKEEDLLIIYKSVLDAGAFLLLDEAFYEFTSGYDSIEVFRDRDFEGVAILRASTKFFGLPGLRLGYGACSGPMARRIEEKLLPWNINSLAEAAGSYIFKDQAYIEESRAYVAGEREFILEGLEGLSSFKTFPSETNYLLIKLLAGDEDLVFDYFVERGFVIRKCSSFRGLDKSFIRIAVKDRENNKKLLEVFKNLDDELKRFL